MPWLGPFAAVVTIPEGPTRDWHLAFFDAEQAAPQIAADPFWRVKPNKKTATACRAVATTRLAAFLTRPQAETKSAQAGCKRGGSPLVKPLFRRVPEADRKSKSLNSSH